jgi:hypothetical protein
MYIQFIMPVRSDPGYSKKKEIIQKLEKECGISIHYPQDPESFASFQIAELSDNFTSAICVIADLSFERPSCYYELGIAEALGVFAFVIAETGTNIHQTENRSQVNFYISLADYQVVVRTLIKQAIVQLCI